MRAAWYRARGELRSGWRATVLLVCLVGLAGGVVLTTVAGARRSSTAYERFRQASLAADLDVSRDGPPSGTDTELRTAVEALPEVAAVAQAAYPFIVPAGSGLYPYLDFLAFVSPDGSLGRRIEIPRMVAGRLPAADRPDEMAVAKRFADEADIGIGDRVRFESFAPDQLEPLFTTGDAGPPSGPEVALTVTGVVEAPTFLSESVGSFVPRVILSPSFYGEHLADIATYPGGIMVRLHDGAADLPTVVAAIRERFGDDPTLELQPSTEVDEKVDASIDVVVGALLLFAAVAGLAGAVAVGQAMSRYFAADASNGRWLAALGMTRRDRVVALVATVVPPAVLGGAVAVVIGVAASPLMPVGIARQAEPDRGLSVDGLVLGAGLVAVTTVVLLLALVAAASVAARTRLGRELITERTSGTLATLRGLPAPAAVGVGMALVPRAGTSTSVRSAFAGVAFGVAGLIAVVVFGASLTGLVGHPERYGAPWDALVSGFSTDVGELSQALAEDEEIDQLGFLQTGQARVGGTEINAHALEAQRGAVALTLLAGRAPTDDGEVALGSSTLDELDVGLGDPVELEGAEEPVVATVVGEAAFPVVDERSSVGRGALLVAAELARLSPEDTINHDLYIGWTAGVDRDAAISSLADETGAEISAPRLPADVNNLRDVEGIPRAIGAFLAALAILAITHALVSTVRLRRHDLAVLRTLGFDGRQLGATAAWQGSTIAVVGLVLGLPLGIAMGATVWRRVASGLGVIDDPAIPALVIPVVVAVTVAVAVVAAVAPARRAAGIRPATVLRAG